MINAAAPLFTALVAALAVRQLPARMQVAGLVIGFLGVVAITSPSLGEGESTGLGIGLVLPRPSSTAAPSTCSVPLQRRNGALPVILRAQAGGAGAARPGGGGGRASDSEFAWSSLAAMMALGALGTGVAFVAFTTLGRPGRRHAGLGDHLLHPCGGDRPRRPAPRRVDRAGGHPRHGARACGAFLTSRQERSRGVARPAATRRSA